MYKDRKTIAILPAAGSGSRTGLPYSKLLCKIDGSEILLRTLNAFDVAGFFDLILIVCRDQDRESFANLAARVSTKVEFVKGGATRQQSVRLALEYLKNQQIAADTLIAVHDAARCFVSVDLIKNSLEAAFQHGAATAALDCVDTIYQVDPSGALEKNLLSRSSLKAMQTPQVFDFELIYKAHINTDQQASDDAGLVAQIAKVVCVLGELGNKKITRPEDF